MKTSLNEIKEIEDYLAGDLSQEERLLLDARQVLDAELKLKIGFQRKLKDVIRLYSRNTMRKQLQQRYAAWFNDPAKAALRKKILQHFQD